MSVKVRGAKDKQHAVTGGLGNTQTEQDESKRQNLKFRSYTSGSNKRKK